MIGARFRAQSTGVRAVHAQDLARRECIVVRTICPRAKTELVILDGKLLADARYAAEQPCRFDSKNRVVRTRGKRQRLVRAHVALTGKRTPVGIHLDDVMARCQATERPHTGVSHRPRDSVDT